MHRSEIPNSLDVDYDALGMPVRDGLAGVGSIMLGFKHARTFVKVRYRSDDKAQQFAIDNFRKAVMSESWHVRTVTAGLARAIVECLLDGAKNDDLIYLLRQRSAAEWQYSLKCQSESSRGRSANITC